MISVWDLPNSTWKPTGIPCPRQVQSNWDHLTIHAEILNGQVHWIDFTLNGAFHALGNKFDAVTKGPSNSLGVHFQMDGDLAGDTYQTFVDKFTLTAW
jgi:hypothetical protein